MTYAELYVTSNFSFLRGASHPEELVEQASVLGYSAIAITDVNTVAGIVRAHVAAKKRGIRYVVGARLVLQDGEPVLVYPRNKQGYESLCTLLTTGNLRAEKGDCILYQRDVLEQLHDCWCLLIPPDSLNAHWEWEAHWINQVRAFSHALPLYGGIVMCRQYTGQDAKWMYRVAELANQYQLPVVATNNVYYHESARRDLQDVLTCVREGTTIHEAGYLLHSNAERYLKPVAEMHRLFRAYPHALENAEVIVADCCFSLDELRYLYPTEITSEQQSPDDYLEELTWKGAHAFYGKRIPDKVVQQIHYELRFIRDVQYAPYFLTVYDLVRFARERGILCQGRGSAANSTVCFCLGITSVNPAKFDLLFERFISAARNEPPDIDVDFEHERREEVIQYIYEKYGRDRAGIVATVTQMHQKGAIRDVGKAMGLSLDTIQKLSGLIHRMGRDEVGDELLRAAGLDVQSPHLQRTMDLVRQYMGFPRQLGQHTGGFVITRGKLHHLCPIHHARMENRTTLEWNKDDIEALGFLKIDVLALGMLTCVRKSFDLIEKHYGNRYALATIPQDDPAVYDMISAADTIGVFQIESRAQQSMLPRLKPRCFYDLVIEVAIVRPGPIQGDMVHPYLRRRNGEEAVDYPSPELKSILERTLGVPLFQEQAMKVAMVAAGFTPSEADELRRSMATFKVKGKVTALQQKLMDGMIRNGYTPDYASRVFKQLEGFGSYGFPESHAASFALLVYVSSWIKYYFPDVFTAALLNSLPMGFYQPAQLIQDVRRHGVTVLPVDVNFSDWDHQLVDQGESYRAIRLGFRVVKGMSEAVSQQLIAGRDQELYRDVDAIRRVGIESAILELLADADAFQSLKLSRRAALWQVKNSDTAKGMYVPAAEVPVVLPVMSRPEEVLFDYASLDFTLREHPLQLLRPKLDMLGVSKGNTLLSMRDGSWVKVVGLVLVRQRPETAKGVWFLSLEDDTGIMNGVLFPQVSAKYRREVVQAKLLWLEGRLQLSNEGKTAHVIGEICRDMTSMLRDLLRSGRVEEDPVEGLFGANKHFR
jgi:error-prone DNA polymerase